MGRVPFVPQMEAVECGAASLAMVLAYHGHHAPLSEVRQACGVSRDGSTAKNIVVAARTYGLVPTAERAEPADLEGCEGPAILHWEMNHFVVLERWTPKGAFIADPGVGRRFVPTDVFDGSFTGISIRFEPGESFEERPRVRLSSARYLSLLRGARSALAMVLFASLVQDALATVVPLTAQVTLDQVIGRHRVDWLFLVTASAIALVTFSALWSFVRGRLLLRIQARLDIDITRQFVAHLLNLPVPFFAQRSVADLMSRVQANKTIRDVLAGQAVGALADGAMLVAYLALMFLFDARLSLVVLAAAAVYVGVFFVGRPLVRAGADEAQRKDVLAGTALLQILRGITTIKSAGVERSSHRRWLNAWIASINAGSRVALRQASVGNVLVALQAIVPVVVLFVGGRRVLDGDLTPGRLVAFQMLQAGFLGPLQSLAQTLLGLQIVPVLLGRMDDVLLSEAEPSREKKCPRLEGAIELTGVGFRYSPTGPAVLADVSLRIAKGTKVALVGPSGSGKSTLARLLLGLYAPTEGSVLLDGHDLSALDPASVRRQYGVVLQETALFAGSVADNLRLFSPNAPLADVVHAARVAQIHDDILALPRGYDTPLSANGGALSGGQRQRLALARAIVHRPPIMILDEATSALDAVTEAAIEGYLSTRACTRIVIAHRLSTVRDADAIFVLDGGRVVERGTHDDLVAAGGLYARLAAGEREAKAASLPPPSRHHVPVMAEDLAPFAPFAAWSDDERAELARELSRVDVLAGTRVVEQDARGTGLYLIAEGEVAIELAEPGLAAWTVADLTGGAVFGEIGLLDGSPASASAVARTSARLLHLPFARFQDLQRRGDVLSVRAVLALGGLVAERTADAVKRLAAASKEARVEAPREPSGGAARRELLLSETLLGASLEATEIEALERMGTRVAFHAGDALVAEGATPDTLFVLRAGRVEVRREGRVALYGAGPGAIVAEAGVFGASTSATSAVATSEVVVFAVSQGALLELLLSGQRVARRLLSPVTEALVRRFRLVNHRLREAVALERGELERAHAAREQAREAAREEQEALGAPAGGGVRGVPLVIAADVEQTGAACLASLLRHAGRAVSLASVVEAFTAEEGAAASKLPRVARSLSLSCRPLEVPLDELRALDRPVLGVLDDDRVVVLESHRFGRWRVMDPIVGRRTVADEELAESFSGAGFEIREQPSEAAPASLPERLRAFGHARLADLARLACITLILQGLGVAASLATALAVQRVFPFEDRPLLGTLVAAGAGLAVSLAVLQQLQSRAILHLRAHFDRELLDALMTHLLELPISFFDRFPPGEVLKRLQAFDNVRLLLSTQGVAVVLNAASLLVAAALLVVIAPRMALVALAVLAVYAITVRVLFPALRRAAGDEVRASARQQDRLIEILQGVVTLRMAGDRSGPVERWFPSFLEELAAGLRQGEMLATVTPLFEWTFAAALVAALWLGARGVVDGTMSAGALVASLSVLGVFSGALHALSLRVLASAPAVVDYGLVRATFAEPRERTKTDLLAPGRLRGKVTVDKVSFRYAEGGPLILDDVSLEIESGTKVALVGPSGSGKSTLGRLLLGLYLPTSGRVLFDDKDVTRLDLEALRRHVGVVLQDPFLLGGSLRENIALGAEGVTLERVVEAAREAAIHDDIEKMAMKYETLVAEGGSTFSGGQRQRIAIARALLSKPAVLLLDEATSALDNLSQAAVERHIGGSSATRIVVAHRLSTIADADRIVVLEKGRIVEQGSHDELLARKGAYFELVRVQLGDGNGEGAALSDESLAELP